MATHYLCACGLFLGLITLCIGREATAVVRIVSTTGQFEDALAAVEKGPLPGAAFDRLTALRQAFAGERR